MMGGFVTLNPWKISAFLLRERVSLDSRRVVSRRASPLGGLSLARGSLVLGLVVRIICVRETLCADGMMFI
jgi:hypothetical protein